MKNLLLFVAAALVIASCSNTTEPTPEAPSMKVPGVGSTFTFDAYDTDDKDAKIPGTDSAFTESVVASNVSYEGKTGVWAVVGETSDTTFYCYDTNKDLLIGGGAAADELLGDLKWLRLPITTGSALTDTVMSTQDFNGIPVELVVVITRNRVGDDQATVGTESIKTVKLTMNINITIKALGQVVDQSATSSTLWYAPSLGAMIRRVTSANTRDGEVEPGTVEMLKSYSLK